MCATDRQTDRQTKKKEKKDILLNGNRWVSVAGAILSWGAGKIERRKKCKWPSTEQEAKIERERSMEVSVRPGCLVPWKSVVE